MTTKRTLLINMFDGEHHNPYMYKTGFDFLRQCSDVEIIQHLPSHLAKVDLSSYTDHGAKSYLQMLYVIFKDIEESLFIAKENDITHLKSVFVQYFKKTGEFDDEHIKYVFNADLGKMTEAANNVFKMKNQPYEIVLDKVLETIDEINGCFILDKRPVMALEQLFIDRINAVS